MTELPPNLRFLFLNNTQINSISLNIIRNRLSKLKTLILYDLIDENGNPRQLNLETQINLRLIMGDRAGFRKDPQLEEAIRAHIAKELD